jgi:hypothetical protein
VRITLQAGKAFSGDSARPDRCPNSNQGHSVIQLFPCLILRAVIIGREIDRHERCTVGDPKLVKDLMKMHFDRAVRDVQPPGQAWQSRPRRPW